MSDLQIQIPVCSPGSADVLLHADFAKGLARFELAGSDTDLLKLDHEQAVNDLVARTKGDRSVTFAAYFVEHFDDGHLGDGDADRRRRVEARLARLIETASGRAIERISIAPAFVAANHPARVRYQEALNRTTDAVDALARLADRHGVRLSIRAATSGFLTSPPELGEWITRINSPAIGVDLDTRERNGLATWPDWLLTLESTVDTLGVYVDTADGAAATEEGVNRIHDQLAQMDLMSPYRKAIVLRPV